MNALLGLLHYAFLALLVALLVLILLLVRKHLD